MTDRLPGLHLQRRTGRRKSTPASPVSPSAFHRKQAHSQDANLPLFSPADTNTNAMSTDSPLIDVELPSPTFDIPALTPTFNGIAENSRNGLSTSRTSDDLSKSRPKFLSEIQRPATSSAAAHYRVTVPVESTSNSPPVGSQRTSGDGQRRPSSRDIPDESSLQRATTFWAQYDRSTGEENTSRGLSTTKKSRFNILSPMSLFAKRRSSQNSNRIEESSPNLHVPPIPENIETSIRGSIVHDFSAPRVRKYNNETSPRPGPSPSYPKRPSDLASPQTDSNIGTPASMHSPMFKEHFHEEQRIVRPSETAYLQGLNLQIPDASALPTFAKKLPISLPDTESDPLSLNLGSETQEPSSLAGSPSEPEVPPPPPPKRTPSPALEALPKNLLPKHNPSTSSRFSFLGQQGSIAQEKLMEEKHKEHAAKNPAPVRLSVVSMDDDYDYDDFDDDDGFDTGDVTIRNVDMPSSQLTQESALPNESDADDDYDFDEDADEFGTGDIEIKNIDLPLNNIGAIALEDQDKDKTSPGLSTARSSKRQSLQAFHFTPQVLSYTPDTTEDPTPRDQEGFAIGKAQTEEDGPGPEIVEDVERPSDTAFYEGLGISTAQVGASAYNDELPSSGPFDDSDLYFDDGEFGDEMAAANGDFDEAALDDAKQIRDIPAENARRYEEALRRSQPDDELRATPLKSQVGSFLRAESPNDAFRAMQESNQAGLTEDNLAAYHDALALAATKAAESGKFNRAVSFSQVSQDAMDSPFHNSRPGISSAGSRYSNNIVGSGISDEDGFGFDDDMDEDALIAAANAEALENDDDGFYGQEFGFFARAYDKDITDSINGGFFASRGSNGIKRSHSGKNNYQEPSLTPITERSEWSTRNSIASLPPYAGLPVGAQSLPSPGLAQLLESGSFNDDDMNLAALMKLRGKAFGGSSTSVNSLADRHLSHSSPLAHSSPYNRPGSSDGGFRRPSPTPQRSYLGVPESDDDDDDGGRPTITQNTPHKKLAQPVRDTSHSSTEQGPSSPISRRGNHSRNSSGGESVSYARDENGRWILERRRTGDSGELELVGREYVPGARI